MAILIMEVAIRALFLCGILYLVAKHEADYSFSKVFLVVAMIALVSLVIQICCERYLPGLGAAVAFVVQAVFVGYMLVKFCWISVPKAVLITAVYAVFHLALGVVALHLKKRWETATSSHEAVVDKRTKDTVETFQMMAEELQGAYVPGQTEQRRVMPPELIKQMEKTLPPDQVAIYKPLLEMQINVPKGMPPAGIPAEALAEMEQSMPPEEFEAIKAAMGGMPQQQVKPANKALPSPPPEDSAANRLQAEPDLTVEKTAPESVADSDIWAEAEKTLAVSGIMGIGNQKFAAIIGDRIVEQGQTVETKYRGKTYSWTIRNIREDGLDVEPLDSW